MCWLHSSYFDVKKTCPKIELCYYLKTHDLKKKSIGLKTSILINKGNFNVIIVMRDKEEVARIFKYNFKFEYFNGFNLSCMQKKVSHQ